MSKYIFPKKKWYINKPFPPPEPNILTLRGKKGTLYIFPGLRRSEIWCFEIKVPKKIKPLTVLVHFPMCILINLWTISSRGSYPQILFLIAGFRAGRLWLPSGFEIPAKVPGPLPFSAGKSGWFSPLSAAYVFPSNRWERHTYKHFAKLRDPVKGLCLICPHLGFQKNVQKYKKQVRKRAISVLS